jgi:hypothetical protein
LTAGAQAHSNKFLRTNKGDVVQRKVFDILASARGLVVVVVLVVAGVLLMWGYSFANSNV